MKDQWFLVRLGLYLGVAICLLVGCIFANEVYQCRSKTGCPAVQNTDHGQVNWWFRKGDVVTTANYVVSTDDGWHRLRKKDWHDVSLIGL